jgi:hypothetical protein
MGDSNLDFGQGWIAFEKYKKKHPEIQLVTETPEWKQGTFVIGVNDYLDLKGDHKYSWISVVKPDDQISHCFLIIRIR